MRGGGQVDGWKKVMTYTWSIQIKEREPSHVQS